jgi:hypothetical protein
MKELPIYQTIYKHYLIFHIKTLFFFKSIFKCHADAAKTLPTKTLSTFLLIFSHIHNQLNVFGGHNPFQEMNQVMGSFSGFGGMSLFNDPFFKNDFMMKPFGDPLESMMGFSDRI